MPKSVLITGASSGIGAACARLLKDHDFQVYGASRKHRESDASIRWLEMDVGDEASVETGVSLVVAEAGRLDAVVCSAGMGIFGSVEEVDIEAAHRQFDTNYFGVVRTLRAALPHMRTAGSGRIAIVGSLAGRAPIPFQAHYSASKAALDALSQSLRNEVRGFGVEVSLIEPGDINTPFNEAMEWGDPDARATSPYAGPLGRCEAVIRESLPKAPGPDVIARAVVRALTQPSPRVRYSAGPDSIAVPLGRRLLPESIVLRLIRSHFKV